jgi:hypothetical protein
MNIMPNHYVYLNPGEKLYVMSDMVAGDAHDYVTVIEVDFPTDNANGELYHLPPKDGKLQAYRVARLELNEQANLTCDGDNLIHAYARQKDGDNAWVSVPTTALPVPKVDVVEDMKDFAVEAK